MTRRPAADLHSVAEALWEERHQLERLLAHLVALRLVLQAGEHRFVSACLDEVLTAAAALQERSGGREAAVAAIGGPAPTLGRLSATAPTPLAWVLGEHNQALQTLLREIDHETRTARRLARNARTQTLDALGAARSSAEDAAALPDLGGFLGQLGDVMELRLRAQSCRGVLTGLAELVPTSLTRFVAEPD